MAGAGTWASTRLGGSISIERIGQFPFSILIRLPPPSPKPQYQNTTKSPTQQDPTAQPSFISQPPPFISQPPPFISQPPPFPATAIHFQPPPSPTVSQSRTMPINMLPFYLNHVYTIIIQHHNNTTSSYLTNTSTISIPTMDPINTLTVQVANTSLEETFDMLLRNKTRLQQQEALEKIIQHGMHEDELLGDIITYAWDKIVSHSLWDTKYLGLEELEKLVHYDILNGIISKHKRVNRRRLQYLKIIVANWNMPATGIFTNAIWPTHNARDFLWRLSQLSGMIKHSLAVEELGCRECQTTTPSLDMHCRSRHYC